MHTLRGACGRIGVFSVAALLVGASSASAGGKSTKQEEAVIVSQTALTKKGAGTPKTEGGKQPGLRANDVFSGQGDKLQAVNESSIAVLQKLINNTSEKDPELPDLLFRMAEKHADQARFYGFKARQLDEEIFVAEQD